MKLILLAAFLCFKAVAFSQSKDSLQFTGDFRKDISSFLKKGRYEVMNGIKTSPKQRQLTQKMNASIQKNRDWYIDYVNSTAPGKELPYHKNFGISESDYEEFLRLAKSVTAVSTKRVEAFIARDEKEVAPSIAASYNFIIVPDLTFIVRLEDSVAIYRQLKLKFTGEVTVDDENNGFKSKWKGYRFEYENPSSISAEDFKNDELNYHSIKLTIALLDNGGKPLIAFRERKIENGEKVVDKDLPLVYSYKQK
jgi:hypothetical protein